MRVSVRTVTGFPNQFPELSDNPYNQFMIRLLSQEYKTAFEHVPQHRPLSESPCSNPASKTSRQSTEC